MATRLGGSRSCASETARAPRKCRPWVVRLMNGSARRKPELVCQESRTGRENPFQPDSVLSPDHHVIHIPHIARNPELFLDETVEAIEVEIGEMLRRQATDRQALAEHSPVRIDDPPHQHEQARILIRREMALFNVSRPILSKHLRTSMLRNQSCDRANWPARPSASCLPFPPRHANVSAINHRSKWGSHTFMIA